MTIRLTLPRKPEKDTAIRNAANLKESCTTPKHKSAAAPRPKPKPRTAIEIDDPADGAYAPPKRPRKLSESSIEQFTLDSDGNEVVTDLPVVRA